MKKYSIDDLLYALEMTIDFLEMEEWPGDDKEAQEAAFREAARRIRRMKNRLEIKGEI